MRAYCVPKTATIRWFIIFILFSIGTTEAFTLSEYKFSKKLSKNISYVKQSIGYCQLSSKKLLAQEAFDIRDDEESSTGSSTSVNFAIHPESEEAFTITSHLGIDESQHSQLAKLAELVVEMNSRLNLISRKDCTLEVVFGRHIIPSIAIVGIPDTTLNRIQNNEVDESTKKMVIDVGTGGGFPGLPLAIINPHVDFLLVDSVGKKLKAVQEMADELGLQNIQTHHGRAEEILDDSTLRSKYKQAFDICVGRSVTSLPRFCFWIRDFLKQKQEQGKLIYIIGGDIEENLLRLVQNDIPIDDLLNRDGASDKRTLVIKAEEVNRIAKESGEKRQKRGTKSKNNTQNQKKRDAPKGSWTKKDNSVKKSRGYENFKRYG